MLRPRLGLKVLGLCVLVLGIGAGGAQAEAFSHWDVAGKSVTGTESFQTEIKEIENKTGQFLFITRSGTKVAILCTSMKWDEGGALSKEGGLSLGRILFTGCVTFLNGTVSSACKPRGGGKALGEILTLKFKGLLVLDEVAGVKEDYVKFTPDEGTRFVRIDLGPECTFETLNVEAKSAGEGFWVKDCNGNTGFITAATTHLFEESLHGLIALGQPVTIDGSAIVGLSSGASWSGAPG
jgi:hypothetical protein